MVNDKYNLMIKLIMSMTLEEIRLNVEESMNERLLAIETDGICARNLCHMCIDKLDALEKTIKEKSTMVFMPIIISVGVINLFSIMGGFYWAFTNW